MELNKIYEGNCIDVMKTFPDKCVDLILTDPPYGVNLGYDIYDDTEENWYKLFSQFIPEATRIAKMVILPSCQIKRLAWIYNNFPPDWLICWYKGSPGHVSYIGFNDWEPLLVYGKTDKISMHDYLYVRNDEKMGKYGHPCPKPLAWADKLITKSTKKGAIVLDPFMGSGTTAVSCIKNGRNWVGIELSPEYIKVAEKRINDMIDSNSSSELF